MEDEDKGSNDDDDGDDDQQEEDEQENQGYGREHRPRRAFNPFGSQFTNGSHDSQHDQPGMERLA